MLAKLWKKVLLAVCIIACIFNIMSKLVTRRSLQENLQQANDGVTVFNIFQKDEVVVSESEAIIEGVKNPEPVKSTEETTNVTENAVIENTDENITENVEEEVPVENEVTEEPAEEENKTTTFKFSDFTIIF